MHIHGTKTLRVGNTPSHIYLQYDSQMMPKGVYKCTQRRCQSVNGSHPQHASLHTTIRTYLSAYVPFSVDTACTLTYLVSIGTPFNKHVKLVVIYALYDIARGRVISYVFLLRIYLISVRMRLR